MILTDCHVHSCFSSDSQTPVEAMLKQAIDRKFPFFYLTDHMDYEFPVYEEGMNFEFNPEEYFSTLEKYQHKYGAAIQIRPAIELGLKPHIATKCQELLNKYPFDFVIGSTHLVNDEDPYSPRFWESRTEKEALSSYFETVIENIRAFPKIDSCGHLDYVIRYAPSIRTTPPSAETPCYRYSDYADYLDEALKLLLQHGIALEVNTAGYVKGLNQPNPQPEVLKRYRELGGELITIGSDAHLPEFYACEFKRTEELLKKLGFKYYAIYEKRKPVMLTL